MMNAVRRRRLMILSSGFLLLAVVSALVLYALRQNINLFYTPSQLKTASVQPTQIIRIGGMVVKGSVSHFKQHLAVQFALTDNHETIQVDYVGILPDLFREGQGIVAIGQRIDANHFKAHEVLAKHDEKYMPPGLVADGQERAS